jgi:hypothetical protein
MILLLELMILHMVLLILTLMFIPFLSITMDPNIFIIKAMNMVIQDTMQIWIMIFMDVVTLMDMTIISMDTQTITAMIMDITVTIHHITTSLISSNLRWFTRLNMTSQVHLVPLNQCKRLCTQNFMRKFLRDTTSIHMEPISQAQDSMVLVVLSMTKLLSLEIKRQVSQLLSQIYKNKYNDTQERLVKSFGILRLRVSKKR